jgi:rhomboid protease GluP
MTLRSLAREVRAYPATVSFCLIWVVIFLAMTSVHLAEGNPLSLFQWLLPGFGGGHRFGDLTLQDLDHGQVWRLMTCNFVHYSLVHIGFNVAGMYMIGTMVESWYGPSQLIVIYGLTGGGGNLISVLIRYATGSSRVVHSGGGSVVILGLVGLCAVVGWRARSPDGKHLGLMMAIVLGMTALLGMVLPGHIDNAGHAGGTLVGFALGLAHRGFLDRASKPSAWGAGVVAALVIAACGGAQVLADWSEEASRHERLLIHRSDALGKIAQVLSALGPFVEQRAGLAGQRENLDAMDQVLGGRTRTAVRALRPLVEAAQVRPLSDPERREFAVRLKHALRQVLQESRLVQDKLRKLQLRRDSRYRPAGRT